MKRRKVCIQVILPENQKDPESETAFQYAAAAVSPNAQHQGLEAPLYSIDNPGKSQPKLAPLLQELHHEKLASQQPFLDCITSRWHRDIHLYSR
jgi:hypothetical protein